MNDDDDTEALAVAYLRSLLHYNPETGALRWKQWKGAKAHKGVAAGYIMTSNGYRYVKIDGILWLAHRLIWAIQTGHFPVKQIDHWNGVPDDNRWDNLREATHQQNMWNRGLTTRNTSGFRGVFKLTGQRVWKASIKIDGKTIYLGIYATPEEASAAFEAAAREVHGDFYREPDQQPLH